MGLLMLLFVLVLLSGVCISMTRQAADGQMGRNGLVGIRTRHTQGSDEAWTAGHAAALPLLRPMWPAAAVGVVAAVTVQVLAGGPAGSAVAAAALFTEVAVVIRASAAANRAARSVGG